MPSSRLLRFARGAIGAFALVFLSTGIAQVPASEVAATTNLFEKIQLSFYFSSANGAFQVVRDGTPRTCLVGGTDQIQVVDDRAGSPGVTYRYTVRTFAPGDYYCQGAFATSAEVTGSRATMLQATNVGARPGVGSEVVVSWTPGVGSGIAVLRDGVSETRCLANNTATWTDPAPPSGQAHSYKVRTYSGPYCSEGYIDSASADMAAAVSVPVAPTGFSGGKRTVLSYAAFSWTASPGATHYELATDIDPNFPSQSIWGSTSNTSVQVSTKEPSLWGRARACNTSGCSGWSSSDYSEPQGIPSIPSIVDASDGTIIGAVQIEWSRSQYATSFNVFKLDESSGTRVMIATGVTGNSFTYSTTDPTVRYYSVQGVNWAGVSSISKANAGYPAPAVVVPSAPAALTASDGIYVDLVEVAWNASANAVNYDLYTATAAGGTKTLLVAGLTRNNYSHATKSGTLFYSVKANSATGGVSDSSPEDGGYPMLVPATPTSVTASDGTVANVVAITWTATAGAASYNLSSATTAGGSKNAIASNQTGTSYNYSTNSGPQYFAVQACNAAGCSAWSTEDSGYALLAPNAPTSVIATDGTVANAVTISWAATTGATSYNLAGATTAGGTKNAIASNLTGTSYNYPAKGSALYFAVQSCNAAGCSTWSTEDIGSALLAPSVPSGVNASDGTVVNAVTINWDKTTGATTYNIAVAATKGGTKRSIASGRTTTAYRDDNATTRQYYAVQACNDAGCSDWSAEDAGYAGVAVADPVLNYGGLWWNPSESGWGINFEHQGDSIFATWFTYDANGKPTWLIAELDHAQGATFTGPVSVATGSSFRAAKFDSTTVVESVIGTMTVSFGDASHATMSYNVDGVIQTKAITLQTFGTAPTCHFGSNVNLVTATNYQGLWWNPSESGWGINLAHQGKTIFATWFVYDDEHKARWMAASMENMGGGVFSGTVFTTTGQPYSVSPWNPAQVAETTAGTAVLRFTAGNAGTLTFDVNGTRGEKPITRQILVAPGTVCVQ